MKYGIIGSSGRMGYELKQAFSAAELVLQVSEEGSDVVESPDVIVDFSRPSALENTLSLCKKHGASLVIGTTGLEDRHFSMLRELGKSVSVVQGYNFSIGIGIMRMILKEYSSALSDWDVEISETHHIHKVDAPSGTAIMLRDAVGRDCSTHSLRMGGVPGDHSVSFANEGEILSLEHRAISRRVFAIGAYRAAEFALASENGFYDFEEVVACALKK